MRKKSFYEKYYKDQPGWAKGVTNVVVVGGVAFALYRWYQSDKKRKDLAAANAAAQLAATELEKLIAQGTYPSYYDSQYENLSQQLVEAMNGCGTDEQKVYNVFRQLQNDADMLKLLVQFGVRFYTPCASSQPISYALWLWDSQRFGGPISTWLGYDLTSGEISKINAILRDRGINYQF